MGEDTSRDSQIQHSRAPSHINYYSEHLPFVCGQPSTKEQFIPSLLAHNHKEYLVEQSKSILEGAQSAKDEERASEILGGMSIKEILKNSIRRDMEEASKELSKVKGGIASGRGGKGMSMESGFDRARDFMIETQETATMVDDDGTVLTVDKSGAVKKDETDEETEERRREELEKLRAKIKKLGDKLSKMEEGIEETKKEREEKEKFLEDERKGMERLKEECKTKEKTIRMLPNAEENLRKLEAIVAKSQGKLEASQKEWERKKQRFLAEFSKQKQAMEERKTAANDLLDEIKSIRAKMRLCAREIREKDTLLQGLVKRLNKLPKSIDRQVYVNRILGVVQNLESQNKQIRQILKDVNELQRETNKISETSKRVFSVTDDLVFRTAQNTMETSAKRQLNAMYRAVVTIREHFDSIVENARNISNTQNEIRDLEYQTLALKEKCESLEIKKVKADVKEVENENDALAKKLKSLRKQVKKLKRAHAARE